MITNDELLMKGYNDSFWSPVLYKPEGHLLTVYSACSMDIIKPPGIYASTMLNVFLKYIPNRILLT